jgi:hypothetical protein
LLLTGCSKGKEQFVVEGNVVGATSPTVCFVTWLDATPKIDTVYIKGGKFQFVASAETIKPVVIYFEKGTNWVTAWVENGDKIHLRGDVNDPEQIQICGNAINELLTDFKQCHKDTPVEMLVADVEAFVKANPSSIASLAVIQDYLLDNVSPETVGNCLALIQSPARENWLYTRLANFIQEKV